MKEALFQLKGKMPKLPTINRQAMSPELTPEIKTAANRSPKAINLKRSDVVFVKPEVLKKASLKLPSLTDVFEEPTPSTAVSPKRAM